MWIKRDDYVGLNKENASLLATLKSNTETIKRLEAEVDYWREKFESAQNRADRVSDLAFESSGFRPISDLGRAEQEKAAERSRDAVKKQEELITELYADSIGEADDELPVDGFGVDPELVVALKQAALQKD